ncbi:hypothetical protein NFI96_003386 [Prochilodus magdalenae]|nr:hypothetical protein NFI96_003386 [Prochilodus magdalenae]
MGGVSDKVASEWEHMDGVSNKVASEWEHMDGVSNKVASEWEHMDGVSDKVAGEWEHMDGVSDKVAGEWEHMDGVSDKVAGEWEHMDGVSDKVAGEWEHMGKLNSVDSDCGFGAATLLFVLVVPHGKVGRSADALACDVYGLMVSCRVVRLSRLVSSLFDVLFPRTRNLVSYQTRKEHFQWYRGSTILRMDGWTPVDPDWSLMGTVSVDLLGLPGGCHFFHPHIFQSELMNSDPIPSETIPSAGNAARVQ